VSSIMLRRNEVISRSSSVNEVRVHYVNLAVDPRIVDCYRRLLSEPERRRADQLATNELSQRFVVSHGVVRIVLGEQLNIDPALVEFDMDLNGKPRLAQENGEQLKFNIAHSHDRALIGVAGVEIGLDIEKIHPVAEIELLARTVLNEAERERPALATRDPEIQYCAYQYDHSQVLSK
jgi:4'-phosphopantetheinyl transferase